MSTTSLDIVKSRPGMYLVVSKHAAAMIEVEDSGVIHQLKLTDLSRDGVLSDGGWVLENIVAFHGPFELKGAQNASQAV